MVRRRFRLSLRVQPQASACKSLAHRHACLLRPGRPSTGALGRRRRIQQPSPALAVAIAGLGQAGVRARVEPERTLRGRVVLNRTSHSDLQRSRTQ